MDDFEAEVTVAHFTKHAYAIALGKRLLMARVKGKESQNELRSRAAQRGVLDQADELASGPVLDIGANDVPFGLCGITGVQLGKRGETRVVLVTQRQMQDEIFVTEDAETDELGREGVARFRARLRRGCRAHCHLGWCSGPYSFMDSTRMPSTSIRAPRGR